MSKQLPEQPSLEHLKNEAKALLRLAKKGDHVASKQVGEPRLANSQLAVAREYGFVSWSKLKRAVEGYANQRDALFAAIRAGDRDRVHQVLTENPSVVHARDPNSFGASAMGAAGHRNDRLMIDLLLQHGADIDARSDWWAGSFGALDFTDEETSRHLLARGATLTAHAAARLGMAEELRQIIARNPAAANERGGDGQYPLHFAKTPEIVDILLDAGAEINARDLDHEGTAVQTRVMDADILKRLVERGAATDIFSAIALQDLGLVKEHLAGDPDALNRRVDEPGNPMIPQAPGWHIYTYNLGFVRPVQAAIKLEAEEIYQHLFELSSPKDQFLAACAKADKAMAEQILSEHPNLLTELTLADRLAVCEAAKSQQGKPLAVLLALGFDVDTEDGEKMTSAHWASFHGRDDLLELILPFKPDLEKKNVYGGTVLSTGLYGSLYSGSKSGNYPRAAEVLIAAGAKLPDKAFGSPEVIQVLRRYSAP